MSAKLLFTIFFLTITWAGCSDPAPTNFTRVLLYDSLVYNSPGLVDSVWVSEFDSAYTSRVDSFFIPFNTNNVLYLVKFDFGGILGNDGTTQIKVRDKNIASLNEYNADTLYRKYEKEVIINDTLFFNIDAFKFTPTGKAYLVIRNLEIRKREYSSP